MARSAYLATGHTAGWCLGAVFLEPTRSFPTICTQSTKRVDRTRIDCEQCGAIPASLAFIGTAQRFAGKKTPLIACVAAALAGFPLLLAGNPVAVLTGATMIGLFGAGILTLALALPPLVAEAGAVHRVAAGMFTIGYTFAFAVPILGGVLWDATHIPATAFFPVVVGALAVGVGALVIRIPSVKRRLYRAWARFKLGPVCRKARHLRLVRSVTEAVLR